jgi:peptidoglycan/xylan/chitin deacetylase (PgdA/CDA1 family)
MHNNMNLAYNPGSTGGQTDYIKLRNASSTDLTENYIPFSDYISGTPQTNTWYSLSIPLVDLGASTSTIKDLIVIGSASTTIYLDDLRFTTPTSSASSSLSQSAVFLEGLVSPWQDGGDWRTTTNFSSGVANTGSVGLEVAYDDPWAGNALLASTSIDTTDFDTLHLAYNPGSTTSQTLYVKLRDDQSVDYGSYISFSDYISGTPQTNTWYELTLPFTDLGVTSGDLVKDMVFTTSGTSTIYLDDIYFVASSTSGTTTDPNSTNVSVYTDMFQNNWTHGGSWLATTTYTSATHTTGLYGIETEFTDGQWSDSAFEASALVDTTNLSTLKLSYNLGDTASHTVYIKTKDETGTDHGSSVSLNNYITNMVANTWHNLTIPLIDLGISVGELVKNIIFISQDGPKVYFDDVYFGEPNTGGGDAFSEGMVSFSFDDGWLDHYTEALPILDVNGIDGTFYIVSEETIQATDLPQLVSNPSLESGATSPNDWSFGSWGDNDATSTYPVAGVDGDDAARIEMTNYTDGDAKWYFDDVNVYSDNKYTVSYQYRSNVTNDFIVRYTLQDDSYQYVTVATNPVSTSWASTTVTVTTPANVKSLTVFPSLVSVGYLEVDDFSVVRNQVFVDPNQVLEIEASGHEIGSHTRHHAALTQVSSNIQEDEIEVSMADLLNTSKIGVAGITSLAYPYGDYNTTVQNLTQSAGYSNARSTDIGFNYPNTNKYALKIQQVDRNTTLSDIQNWVQTAKQDKTWLILMFHQIDDVSAHSLGVTSELLEDIAEYVASDGINTVTVGEGVGLME